MYITENQNIGESVLFLLSARNSLSEMVEDSGHENADVMVNFLMNEASDYEIMSLLVTGQLPDEQYNQVAESYLFSMLKEQVLRNSETITEMIGERTFNDFLGKVDSVYPNVSTAGPMLEFFSAQHPQIAGAMLLSERPRMGDLTPKKMADIPKPPKGPQDTAADIKSAEGGATMTGGMKSFPGGKVAPTGKGASADASMAKDAKAGGFTQDRFSQEYPHQAMPKEPLATRLGDVAKDIKASASELGAKFSKWATGPEGKIVGGAALAALLAYAAAKTYKRFFSKAAGACRGMSGGAKTDCMNKFRGRALMAQAADLQRGMASCAKAKNPATCKSAVSGKIERLKAKARKISGQ